MKQLIIASILLSASSLCYGYLPPSITVCSRNEPKLTDCILNSVKELQPKLASGKLDDDFVVPALEPLALDSIKMERGAEFKAFFSSLLIRGPSNFVIEKLKVNIQNTTTPTFEFIITLPFLEFTGKYQLKIRLLLLDIQGKGDMNGSFENSRARVRMKANKVMKEDGKEYLKFDKFAIKIQIGKNKLHLKNLFNGDPTLGQIGNTFINENSELFLSEIIPGLEKNLADIFTSTANEIVARASFEELFPDVPPKSA